MRVTAALVGVTILAAVLSAAALSATSGYFETPSTNIVCGYFVGSGYPAFLECGVASGLVPSPPKPRGGCHDVDPASNRIRLQATGRTFGFCAGDVGVLAEQGRVPSLAYGAKLHEGPFSCSSAAAGLTCTNRSGHGFFLSRQRWHTF